MVYRPPVAVLERRAELRECLVAEGTAIVSRQGWAGLTVTAAAAAAGISAGALYKHFPSKASLATEVFNRAAGREVEVLATALADSSYPDVVSRLANGVATFAWRAVRGRQLAYSLIAEPVEPPIADARLALRRRYRDVFAAVIAEGIERGEMLDSQIPEISAAALTGAVAELLVGPLSAAASGPAAELIVGQASAIALRCAGVLGTGPHNDRRKL
ncbi:MAG: TetR/AcrR family transcriptional regulator [Acidimicrobiales bacterium]